MFTNPAAVSFQSAKCHSGTNEKQRYIGTPKVILECILSALSLVQAWETYDNNVAPSILLVISDNFPQLCIVLDTEVATGSNEAN